MKVDTTAGSTIQAVIAPERDKDTTAGSAIQAVIALKEEQVNPCTAQQCPVGAYLQLS
jgi:hypothetical protein